MILALPTQRRERRSRRLETVDVGSGGGKTVVQLVVGWVLRETQMARLLLLLLLLRLLLREVGLR